MTKPCNDRDLGSLPPVLILIAHLAGMALVTGMILGLSAILALGLKHIL
jgi:hypothetical protein